MAVELGQIEKPDVENFRSKRKLYCVPNVYPIDNAPDDYKTLFNKYWDEVDRHIEKLENAGKIKKIFCENIAVHGEDAFKALEKINARALQLIKKKSEEGAEFFPLEDGKTFGSFLDWANCLKVVRSAEVFEKVLGFFNEASEKRIKSISEIIETNLRSEEAGLLIMNDEDRMKLQFPLDVEVFLVTPPAYNDILKWFRDKMKDLS